MLSIIAMYPIHLYTILLILHDPIECKQLKVLMVNHNSIIQKLSKALTVQLQEILFVC